MFNHTGAYRIPDSKLPDNLIHQQSSMSVFLHFNFFTLTFSFEDKFFIHGFLFSVRLVDETQFSVKKQREPEADIRQEGCQPSTYYLYRSKYALHNSNSQPLTTRRRGRQLKLI